MFDRSNDELATPGPGQYNSQYKVLLKLYYKCICSPFSCESFVRYEVITSVMFQSHVVGGQSLQNRSRRFEEVVSVVPGPGAYDLSLKIGSKPKVTSRRENMKLVCYHRKLM